MICSTLDMWSRVLKSLYCLKKTYVDVIIPWGGDNDVIVNLIVQHIHAKLSQHHMCKLYQNLYVIHSTFQVILLTWFYCCNFFRYLSETFLFVTKFWIISSEFLDLNSHNLKCERKRRIIQMQEMHTFVRDVTTRMQVYVMSSSWIFYSPVQSWICTFSKFHRASH
jgi:hypothetical protein